MTGIARSVAGKVLTLLTAPAGLNASLAAVSEGEAEALPPIEARQIVPQNVPAELAERSGQASYPAVHIYCEKLTNNQREKFRTFSGAARMVVEARFTQDRLEGIEGMLQLYVDAVARVLDQSRGDWSEGMYYTGGYEVTFGPVKHGGKNFVQTAKITFEVGVSRS
jgi:hypothetical protein